MLNLKMGFFFFLLFPCLLALTGAGQESIRLLNLHDPTSMELSDLTHSDLPIGVSVNSMDLNGVSHSVLMAESWLRTHVLAHYPATRITTIVAAADGAVICQEDEKVKLVLAALKNIYYSLTRWGLENEIALSIAFSSKCLNPNTEKFVKPLVQFLQSKNYTYSVNPPPKISPFSDEIERLVSSHTEAMKKIGFLEPKIVNVIVTRPKRAVAMSRNLLSDDPIPIPSTGFPVPSNVAKKPHPPLPQIATPPAMPISFGPEHEQPPAFVPAMPISFGPEQPPAFVPASPPYGFGLPPAIPASPPYGFGLPPCNPADTGAVSPAPVPEVVQKLWCVAKPSVPADSLQEAIDYACGAGGADCGEITPQGRCYNPDTVVAHASYAFNSYWQKNKRNGGTCNFGGTAMLINSDPSFLDCRFDLS